MKVLAVAALTLALATPAFAQALDGNSLTWLAGSRVHTNSDGSKVYEAFTSPINGVVTGTALSAAGLDQPNTEYQKLGPNAEGRWGLAMADSRSNMAWTFTPLKAIEKDRVVFQAPDGSLTVTYFAKSGGGVGSKIERVAGGRTVVTEYDFKPASAVAESKAAAKSNNLLSPFLNRSDDAPAPGKMKAKGF
jgi:hypothetical protein